MATGNITVTTVDAFIPEIWSQEIILATVNRSVMAGLVRTDFDSEISAAGDVIHVPVFSAVNVGDKATGGTVVYDASTEGVKDVTIDKHKYFAFRVEDIASVQSQPNLVTGYSSQGGAGIAKQIDIDVSNLMIDAAVTQNVGATNSGGTLYTDITDAVIRNAIQLLDEAEAPEENRYLVISPAQKNAMLGIDKFVEADKNGTDSTLRTGQFGTIYGVMVFISNNLPDVALQTSLSAGHPAILARKVCAMFHSEAFALVTQMNPRVQAAYDIDYLATSVVGDVLYGVGELRGATYAVQVRTTAE